jgi:predicted nucleotidyltransferase
MKEEVLRSHLSAVKARLEKAGIEWAVFAGAASFCYGSQRIITDVDILLRSEDLERARAVLEDLDLARFDVGCGADMETEQGTCPFYLDDNMIGRRQWRELFGVKVPVISVEDNIVLKAILQRGQSEGKYDLEDIRDMLTNQRIDLDYLKTRIQISQSEKRVKPVLQPLIPRLF